MNYKNVFGNMAKALDQGFSPQEIGGAPDSAPRRVEVESETLSVSESLMIGTVAGYPSDKLLDTKDHFPVITETQAQSSMARVIQLSEVPSWYRGSLSDLRQEVYAGIMRIHPGIDLNVRVSADLAVALSDGQTPASTTIKDPEDDRKQDFVPQVARPKLSSAQIQAALESEEIRQAIAGRLMEVVDKQLEIVSQAKKLAARLLKGGVKSEEFDSLSTYLQEGVLHELMSRGASASTESRRQQLLNRMQNHGN